MKPPVFAIVLAGVALLAEAAWVVRRIRPAIRPTPVKSVAAPESYAWGKLSYEVTIPQNVRHASKTPWVDQAWLFIGDEFVGKLPVEKEERHERATFDIRVVALVGGVGAGRGWDDAREFVTVDWRVPLERGGTARIQHNLDSSWAREYGLCADKDEKTRILGGDKDVGECWVSKVVPWRDYPAASALLNDEFAETAARSTSEVPQLWQHFAESPNWKPLDAALTNLYNGKGREGRTRVELPDELGGPRWLDRDQLEVLNRWYVADWKLSSGWGSHEFRLSGNDSWQDERPRRVKSEVDWLDKFIRDRCQYIDEFFKEFIAKLQETRKE